VATSRPVRIPKARVPAPPVSTPEGPAHDPTAPDPGRVERRENRGGSQRAIRVTALFVLTLGALYAAFALYDRTAPGGAASPVGNGLLLFTVVFLLFAVVGAAYSLSPAPRAIEVAADRVTVVGRWGRRTRLPPLERLWVVVARRYRSGFFSAREVELVEVSGEDTPRRSYLVDSDLFAGASSPTRPR
jgi:hypothetical protein